MSASVARQFPALRELLGFEDPPLRPCAGVAGYNGAALWLGPDGEVADQNAGAEVWMSAEGLDAGIEAMANEVRSTGVPSSAQCELDAKSGALARRYNVTAIPYDGGVLVLGQEISAEARHIQILKASREMFRELALSANGLLFETDVNGLIHWVGHAAILGYRDEDLLGRPARELLTGGCALTVDPFAARQPIIEAPFWFDSADEGPRAMTLTLRPIISKTGLWGGVRGLARDVTEDLRGQRRERVSRAMLDVIRGREGAAAMLAGLAGCLADGCGVEGAWLVSKDPQHECASSGVQAPCEMMREIAARVMSEAADTPVVFSSGDWSGLAIALRAQGQPVGAALIGRPTAEDMLDHEALDMLRQAAPLLSVALMQTQTQEALRAQRSLDPLTGLLNMRGFLDQAERRRKAAAERQGTPALFLISCGHFKAIGDCLGAAAGEELLIEIAHALRGLAKDTGLCARLEMSEFALFCDHIAPHEFDATIADIHQAFRNASRRMSLALAVTPNVAVSTGDPRQPIGHWIAEATQTLAAAKRKPRHAPKRAH